MTRELINEILKSIGLESIEHDDELDEPLDNQPAGQERYYTIETHPIKSFF